MTQVLDAGYCDLIETWGSDERIIESARMSTDAGFRGWEKDCPDCLGHGVIHGSPGEFGGSAYALCQTCNGASKMPQDAKLLRYLWEHKHHTPFEMAGATFEIKAPIFVFREWHRHRTQSYNEMSARYVPLPDEAYLPTVERVMTKADGNKQAQGTGTELTETHADMFLNSLALLYHDAQETYRWALEAGVPKELARLVIPVGRYSKMRASANLRNWLAFLTLRNDKDAQWEIRQYAQAVQAMLKEAFPRTLALFEETTPLNEINHI